MARSAWLRMTSVGIFAGSLGFLVLGGCFDTVAAQPGDCKDDGNPCTKDSCDANGNPTSTPEPDNSQCFFGENEGICKAGTCELNCKKDMVPCKCTGKADCPSDTVCGAWACTAGQCVTTPLMEGETVDPLNAGDCQKKICQGGALKVVDDPADTVTDVKGDCQDPVCNAGVPAMMANNNDVPMTDTDGDCMKPVCNAGVPGVGFDDMDPPPPTECSTFTCNMDGTWSTATKKVGETCSDGPMGEKRACDKGGMCVACLPAGKDDYEKCKMNNGGVCPIKLCLGEMATNATDCVSGVIADKVCCDTACTEECKSCAVSGMGGTCTNIPYYQTDPAYIDQFMAAAKCETASRCNGMGKCMKIVNKSCAEDMECISGKCAMPAMLCLGAKGESCTNGSNCVSGVCNAMGSCD